MDAIQKSMLEKIADLHEVPEGAYNIRSNGALAGRNTTANIDIVTKQDKPGIDIIIKPGTKNESVHMSVIHKNCITFSMSVTLVVTAYF